MNDSKVTVNEPPPPLPDHESALRRCLNPNCKRTCDDDRRAKVRILGGRTVRYCCNHCMSIHAATGVITKPKPKI